MMFKYGNRVKHMHQYAMSKDSNQVIECYLVFSTYFKKRSVLSKTSCFISFKTQKHRIDPLQTEQSVNACLSSCHQNDQILSYIQLFVETSIILHKDGDNFLLS